jgi:NitT/TauT family transport system ATP-binding protein
MAPLLSIEGVTKEYHVRGKNVLALDSIDLSVNEGEFVTIVGPSGCGKSTLLNLIVGLLRSSSGRILFHGNAIDGISTKIGYVTQKDNLLHWRTLIENVEIALEIRGLEKSQRRQRAGDLIAQVGLHGFEDHYPHELSGGMRQRANIIRTLIYDPELILMYEPFGPLDAQTRVVLQEQLLALWSSTKKTIVFITHDLVEAIALADRVVLMTSRREKSSPLLRSVYPGRETCIKFMNTRSFAQPMRVCGASCAPKSEWRKSKQISKGEAHETFRLQYLRAGVIARSASRGAARSDSQENQVDCPGRSSFNDAGLSGSSQEFFH